MPDLWTDVRREFPATTHYTYLNAAAASPLPRCVRSALDEYTRQFEAEGDLRWDAWIAQREDARQQVATLVGAHPDEIAFVPNTSTGINAIVDLLEHDGPVVTDRLEFPTVTLPWIHRGVDVRFVSPRPGGVLVPADFISGEHLAAATIAISHVQFSNGCRQDLSAFGVLKGARHLVVSASQSAGVFPIAVHADGVDALASAGRKWLCAGYGTGFLFVSRALLSRAPRTLGWLSVEDPFGFDNERYRLLPTAARFEPGCPSFGPIIALGAAVRFLLGIGIDVIRARVLALNTYLTDQLRASGIEVLSPGGVHRSGATLCRAANPPAAVAFLRERGVLVTEKPEGVRIATHCYNAEEDVDTAVRALRNVPHF